MDNLLTKLYKQMYLIRKSEEKLLNAFDKGLISGTVHTSIGQEACSVGVINNLDLKKDIIFSNHRGHGHFLAYSNDLVGLFGEVCGKSIGVCGGIGGSQHLQKDNFYTNGIQGSIVPVATGMAFAEKEKKSNSIVTVFIGDGTFGQGVVYESMNIASLWNLPLLIVLENNQYAQSTPTYLEHSGELSKRAESFKIKSDELDVKDAVNVYDIANKSVNYVRNNSKPFFLVLNTYRLAPHSKGKDYRDKNEIMKYKNNDPLLLMRNKIKKTDIDIISIEESIEKEIELAFNTAINSDIQSWDNLKKKINVNRRYS